MPALEVLVEVSPDIQTPNNWLLREKEVRVYLWSHPLSFLSILSFNPQRNTPSEYTGDD